MTWHDCWCQLGSLAHLSILELADLLGFSHTTISGVFTECSEKEKTLSELELFLWVKMSLMPEVMGEWPGCFNLI